jgi:hypothetical protein
MLPSSCMWFSFQECFKMTRLWAVLLVLVALRFASASLLVTVSFLSLKVRIW